MLIFPFISLILGSLESSSFTIESSSMIFAERNSRKLDSLHKYKVKILEKKLSLEREWMKTYHNSDFYVTGKGVLDKNMNKS